VFKGIFRDVTATLLSNKSLQLLDAGLLTLDAALSLQRDPVVGVKLLLQLDNGLVSLVQSGSQRDHNVALLQQQLFVSVDLRLALLDLIAFALNLIQLGFVLLSDALLLFFERGPELRSVFDFLATGEDLRVHCLDLFFQRPLVLLSLKEFMRADFKRVNGRIFVGFCLLFLSLQLGHIRVIHDPNGHLFSLQFSLELLELNLVLAKKGALVDVFIDYRFVLYFFGPGREFECLVTFIVGVEGWRHHGNHRGLAVAAQGVLQESCELRVAERNVHSVRLLSEGIDYVSQGRQRLVDFLGLVEAFTRGAGYSHALTARQVDEVKLPYSDCLGRLRFPSSTLAELLTFEIERAHLLDNDEEDSMGPRGHIVHLR